MYALVVGFFRKRAGAFVVFKVFALQHQHPKQTYKFSPSASLRL
ncbi:hypothetical protein HAL013_02360 [Helicobacter ailurogastricus]|uniref:Uncharacterized protein n=1 Tax=Helicobacter ailurogastricus TaxID=1578720 RepID=A0A0K2X4F8_9HELI|nr:hypothetical protein HAL011_09030 [Helicobacter ailurogastricus]CRF42080.1 hypothetical protein HAL013_02360 [Helicobacter ailurogastricus]CRF44959.1 hypothetical protein HAL09_15870 [Helicobacter ailurogastricus]